MYTRVNLNRIPYYRDHGGWVAEGASLETVIKFSLNSD